MTRSCCYCKAGCFLPQVGVVTAGHHSLIQEECEAHTLSFFQADTLLEGLYWGQLSDSSGGMRLV